MYKRKRIKGKRLAVSLSFCKNGSVGTSVEFDVWIGKHYRYLSIGRKHKRFGGRLWLRTGGF